MGRWLGWAVVTMAQTNETKLKSSLSKRGRLVSRHMFPQFLCVCVCAIFYNFFFYLRLSKPSSVMCPCILACLPHSGDKLFRWCFIMEIVSTSGFRVSHITRTHSHSSQQQNKSSLYPSSKEQQKKKLKKSRRTHSENRGQSPHQRVGHWSGCSCRKNMMRFERLLMCEKQR